MSNIKKISGIGKNRKHKLPIFVQTQKKQDFNVDWYFCFEKCRTSNKTFLARNWCIDIHDYNQYWVFKDWFHEVFAPIKLYDYESIDTAKYSYDHENIIRQSLDLPTFEEAFLHIMGYKEFDYSIKNNDIRKKEQEKRENDYIEKCQLYFKENPQPILTREELLIEQCYSIVNVNNSMGSFYGNHGINVAIAIYKFTKEEILDTIKNLGFTLG